MKIIIPALLFAVTVPAAHAVEVVDINMTPTPGYAIGGGSSVYQWEQSYVAGVTGKLVALEFYYKRPLIDDSPTGNGLTSQSVILALGHGESWLPFETLAQFVISLPVAETATVFHFDLNSANFQLTSGQAFVVGWQGVGSPGGFYPSILAESVSIEQGVRDLNFNTGFFGQSAMSPAIRTFVETSPVPEPETYAMLLAGLGLVGFAVHRRA